MTLITGAGPPHGRRGAGRRPRHTSAADELSRDELCKRAARSPLEAHRAEVAGSGEQI